MLPTPRTFILYVAFMAMLGPIGEVFIGTIYHGLFGERLWFYQLAPIHHGYTSLYAPVIWGIYGGYLGLVEPLLRQWKLLKKKYALALFISFETLVLELLFNVLHRLITGEYLFFYTPPDLWHATSVQTIPFYFFAGFVIVSSIKRMKTHSLFFAIMCLLICLVMVYLT